MAHDASLFRDRIQPVRASDNDFPKPYPYPFYVAHISCKLFAYMLLYANVTQYTVVKRLGTSCQADRA